FTGLFGIGLVGFLANRATNTYFDQWKLEQVQNDFMNNAKAYYVAHGSWVGFLETLKPDGEPDQGGPFGPPPPQFILVDEKDSVICPAPPYHTGDSLPEDQLAHGTPIIVNGQKVGTVLFAQGAPRLNPSEQRYLAQTNQSILLGAVGAIAIALLV